MSARRAQPETAPRRRRTDAPERILASAMALFADRGFAAIGVNEIGAHAGLTGPALYRHYSSKQEILAAIFDAAMDRVLELAGPPREDPYDDLAVLVGAQIEFVLTEPVLLSIYVHDDRALIGNDRRRVHRRQRKHAERWERAIGLCRPELAPAETTSLTHAALGMIHSVVWWPRDARGEPQLAAYLRAAVFGAIGVHHPDNSVNDH